MIDWCQDTGMFSTVALDGQMIACQVKFCTFWKRKNWFHHPAINGAVFSPLDATKSHIADLLTLWSLVKMEAVLWFVEPRRLNPGGKYSFCCVTAISTCLFLIYGWIKPPVKYICFSLGYPACYELPLKWHQRSWFKSKVWSRQPSTVLEVLWEISHSEANLSNLMAHSAGPLSL